MHSLCSRLGGLFLCGLAVLGLGAPQQALAAGYDTPILYSARHMGMGGTAISSVDDPSALFHNPAGLAAARKGSAMLSLSPLYGQVRASPSNDARSAETDPAVSPFFLAGGSYRLNERFVFGLGVFPLGGAAGGYTYSNAAGTKDTTDSARLSFIEVAPALAVDLAPGLRLGLAARVTRIDFLRHVVNTSNGTDIPYIDLEMSGWNLAGYRLGLQYSYGRFDFGLVYRNRITAEVMAADNHAHEAFPDFASDGSDAVVTGIPASDVSFTFILPSKLGAGVQWRATDDLRLAFDLEWVANSDNDVTEVAGTAFPGTPAETKVKVPNPSYWMDSQTFRLGAAYSLGNAEVRAGYIYDTQATRESLPSAFGTPPAATQTLTAGVGYKISDRFDVSLAGAYRSGKAEVTAADLSTDPVCQFCGKDGDYEMNLFGGYVDVRWHFGGSPSRAPMVASSCDLPETATGASH